MEDDMGKTDKRVYWFAQNVPCPSPQPGVPDGPSGEKPGCQGLVAGHSYSIMAAGWFDVGGQAKKMLNLHNPWANTEWTGPFADTDPQFAQLCKNLKDEPPNDFIVRKHKRGTMTQILPAFEGGDHAHEQQTRDRDCIAAEDGSFWLTWEDFNANGFMRIANIASYISFFQANFK